MVEDLDKNIYFNRRGNIIMLGRALVKRTICTYVPKERVRREEPKKENLTCKTAKTRTRM